MSSLYVHIPFCARKCLYCSFVVAVAAEKSAEKYLDCLTLEASRFKGMCVETLYIGGGTPSRLSPDQIIRLMGALRGVFDCSRVTEITMEVNPEDIDGARLDAMKKSGVNRLSMGVQTFHERYLKYLGRHHGVQDIMEAAKSIRAFNFDSVNMDLMFGFEGQMADDLRIDIDRMMALGPDHISLYGLSVEPHSRFFAQGKVASSEQQAQMYMMILAAMKKNGFVQYEVSNFSRPGHESAHNKNYWTGKDYIGLGVGAHSYQNGRRWWNISRVSDYMARLESGRTVEQGHEQLAEPMRSRERLLIGLRMNEGVDLGSMGIELKDIFEPQQRSRLDVYIREGLLAMEGRRIRATDKGRLVLDEISSMFI